MGSNSLSFLLSKASKIDHKYLLMRSKKIFKNKRRNDVLTDIKLSKKLDISKKSRASKRSKKSRVSKRSKKNRVSKKSKKNRVTKKTKKNRVTKKTKQTE